MFTVSSLCCCVSVFLCVRCVPVCSCVFLCVPVCSCVCQVCATVSGGLGRLANGRLLRHSTFTQPLLQASRSEGGKEGGSEGGREGVMEGASEGGGEGGWVSGWQKMISPIIYYKPISCHPGWPWKCLAAPDDYVPQGRFRGFSLDYA